MAEVNVAINGRNFAIHCEDGQEQRLTDLGHYVDARLKGVSQAGAANNEAHLLVLTALILADEVFELRDEASNLEQHVRSAQSNQNNDADIAQAINELSQRIDSASTRIQNA